jgi:hypothetical protein
MIDAIEQAEKELKRDKDDLRRLKKRYPDYHFVPIDPKSAPDSVSQRTQKKEFTELQLAVLGVVNSDVDKEWTSRMVTESLRALGSIRLPQNEDAVMNAVGYALIELRDADKILRSHEGKGRDPHRYCAIPIEKEATPEETTS